MTKIAVITGSSRPGRFNIQPSQWILEIAKKQKNIKVEFIDVQELNLPFLDEPVPPLQQKYSKDHTKKWSKKIHDIDGFILVTPEYNHSTSAVLKNAIDYLSHEWNYKPVVYVSYGSQAGGARAVEHLRGVAGELKMFDLKEQVLIPNYWERMNEEGKYQFSEGEEKLAIDMVESLVFWAGIMKDAREKLKK